VHNAILDLHTRIAELECPRDDSLDNSIVVWLSNAFGNLEAGSSGGGSSGGAATAETSVFGICGHFEDSGNE
jgi:hypothetical protein